MLSQLSYSGLHTSSCFELLLIPKFVQNTEVFEMIVQVCFSSNNSYGFHVDYFAQCHYIKLAFYFTQHSKQRHREGFFCCPYFFGTSTGSCLCCNYKRMESMLVCGWYRLFYTSWGLTSFHRFVESLMAARNKNC